MQIKATGTGRGPAFSKNETRADHLIFLDLDFENATGTVLYNGPEKYVIAKLANRKNPRQCSLSRKQIIELGAQVKAEEQLPRLV